MRPTMRHLFSAALAGLLVLAFHTPASAQAVIRLRNGRYVLAKIDMQTPPDEDGLVLQRLDNGGRLELQWSDLATEYADKLREEYHLVDGNEKEKATIEATRVVWTEGGRRHELVGIETGRDTEYLYIKRQKNTWKVRIQDLRGVPESVVAPMVDVLTPQEIYERKRAEIAPEKDADKHVELAVFLLGVDDYEHALEHLTKAKDLGGGAQPNRIEGLMAKTQNLIKHRAEAELLHEINVLKNRGQFESAKEKVEEFEQRFPKSPLAADFEAAKRRLDEAREAYLIKRVALGWYEAAKRESGRLALDRSLSLDAVRENVESRKLSEAIATRVANSRKITPQEARSFLALRLERHEARMQKSSYGIGSWVLGKKAIRKGAEKFFTKSDDKKAEDKQSVDEKRRREIQKRLREWKRRAAGGGRGKNQKQKQPTPEDWWKQASTNEKKQWILSYYAEKGGDLEFVSATLRNCPTCAGRGVLEFTPTTGGQTVKQVCPTCHGTQFHRVVRFH